MKSYRSKLDNIQANGVKQEKLLIEIRDVLLRIESMLFVNDVARKQILKGNE
jgi:hypothetical protein